MDFEELFNTTVEFKDCKLENYSEGEITMTVLLNDTNLNPYGRAHGGFLYTICDTLAGVTAYSLGSYALTQHADISYLKEGKKEDVLTFHAQCIHNGKSTKVIEIAVTNQKEALLLKASFTMFVLQNI